MDAQQLATKLYDIASSYLDSEAQWVIDQAIKAGEPEGPIISIITAASDYGYVIPNDLIYEALNLVEPENRDLIEASSPHLRGCADRCDAVPDAADILLAPAGVRRRRI